MVEEPERTHNQKVENIKGILLGLNLPILPLNTVRCEFYTPDIVTRLGLDKNGAGFIPIDVINSKERVAYDIGGLALLYRKDIVAFCLALIDDALWEEHLRAFRIAKLNLPPKLYLIPMRETREFFDHTTLVHPPHADLAGLADPVVSNYPGQTTPAARRRLESPGTGLTIYPNNLTIGLHVMPTRACPARLNFPCQAIL